MMKRMMLMIFLMATGLLFSKDYSVLDRLFASGLIEQNIQGDIAGNIERISARFLGRPYDRTGPLGEGSKGRFDQDPLFRLDRFDCCTYVETVLALAMSKDFGEFISNLVRIRYSNGTVSYRNRKHFTSLTWIPDNIEKGLLRDITEDIAGSGRTLSAEAIIDRRSWYMAKTESSLSIPGLSERQRTALLVEMKATGVDMKPVKALLPYAPISVIMAEEHTQRFMARIPSGSVVNIVRPGWDLRELIGTCLNVSHQGFLIRKQGRVYIRHASSSGCVREDPLEDYLSRYMNHPTVGGINILVSLEK